MSVLSNTPSFESVSPVRWLLPLGLLTFLGFLAIGLPLAVVPGQVHGTLGFGASLVGLAMGAQSVATLFTRQYAGNIADAKGARSAVIKGLLACALSCVIYLASVWFVAIPPVSLAILLAGRVLLGLGESLLITASMAWGIGLLGPQHSGRVIAWSGIAMYGAMAIGAPVGVLIEGAFGFAGVSLAAGLAPLAATPFILLLKPVQPSARPRLPFLKVVRMVWLPGMGVTLATFGFALLIAFVTLLFAEKRWEGAAWALTVFGVGYILVRLFFARMPDRFGGANVAAVSLAIEAVGQVLLWRAETPQMAFIGAGLTGIGYSLVLPSFGVEVIRRVPAQNRGGALGAFVAFWDLTMGIAAPLSGVMVASEGYSAVYLVGVCGAALGVIVALILKAGAAEKSVP